MDGDDKKHNMFYIFGPKMAHKRIVLMFFFLWCTKKWKVDVFHLVVGILQLFISAAFDPRHQ